VLIEAMSGLDTCLEIAAYSPWVKRRAITGIDRAGERVRTVRHGYPGMRDAYARALAVAIPLRETPIQAGSLVLYEAMAMSKPVIATRTEGLERLGVLQHGETGLFVAPGDTKGWRAAVGHLTSNPNEAARMGQNARAIVDHGLNLDAYATQMGRLVNEDRIEIA
jgi:glycosyltransferase involved in cell wall biosynthesis